MTRAHAPGYTYSDLVQRLLPSFAMDAFPNDPVTFEKALSRTLATEASPEFKDDRA